MYFSFPQGVHSIDNSESNSTLHLKPTIVSS